MGLQEEEEASPSEIEVARVSHGAAHGARTARRLHMLEIGDLVGVGSDMGAPIDGGGGR